MSLRQLATTQVTPWQVNRSTKAKQKSAAYSPVRTDHNGVRLFEQVFSVGPQLDLEDRGRLPEAAACRTWSAVIGAPARG